jgi:kinesin family protein C1
MSVSEVAKKPQLRGNGRRRSTSSKRLAPSTSEPELPETPAAELEAVIDVSSFIETLRPQLESGKVDLAVLFDEMLGETAAFEELMMTKPNIVKNKHESNYKCLKSLFLSFRTAAKGQLDRRKAFVEAVCSIQSEIDKHNACIVKKKDDEIAALRLAQEMQTKAWKEEREQMELNCEERLAYKDKILEQLITQKDEREQELSNLVELRHNELKEMTSKYENQQESLFKVREELVATKAVLAVKEEEIIGLKREKCKLDTEYQTYRDHNSTTNEAQMQAISQLAEKVQTLTTEVREKEHQVEVREITVNQNQDEIEQLRRMLMQEEQRRREAHNALQELKGNIRVYCRARPVLPGNNSALQISTASNRITLQCNRDSNNQAYNFSFDKVFDDDAGQIEVFNEVSDLVQSALDGYKVCIFAYGQTGSGKTHTMQGQPDPNTWGVIPRSLSLIVKSAIAMRSKGWTWTFKTSFLEVYNEAIRDLLRTDAEGPRRTHTIIHDNAWGSVVTDMTEVEVSSTDETEAMDQIRKLMTRAASQRAVGQTQMNEESSRSHSLFAMYLHGMNRTLDEELFGALHLVDLAGSERVDKSGASGARLAETGHINKSLSSMADVFLSKAENRSHVPFRNSKLTHLLEPCLSGQGKTLMMLNVAPEESHAHETLCSLNFASKVAICNTGGKPKKAVKSMATSGSRPEATVNSRSPTPSNSRHPTPTSRSTSARGNYGRSTSTW